MPPVDVAFLMGDALAYVGTSLLGGDARTLMLPFKMEENASISWNSVVFRAISLVNMASAFLKPWNRAKSQIQMLSYIGAAYRLHKLDDGAPCNRQLRISAIFMLAT